MILFAKLDGSKTAHVVNAKGVQHSECHTRVAAQSDRVIGRLQLGGGCTLTTISKLLSHYWQTGRTVHRPRVNLIIFLSFFCQPDK